MESFTMGSGKRGREMAEGNRFGKMEHFIKDTGSTIWRTVRED